MRPEFHFTADGWINDPHGITFANGRYHLFFQYAPGSSSWSLNCSWGHASGRDLFSLTELPPALTPGDGDDGIWSGALQLSENGSPRIFYTSVSQEHPSVGRIRTATPLDPQWITWEKGPVVAEAPRDLSVEIFRDPVVIADDGAWRMLVGAGLTGNVAAAVGFTSPDGVTWQPDGVVASRAGRDQHPVWSGSMWECPQIIEVGGRHALIVSVWDEETLYDVLYALGEYQDGVFTAQIWGRLSYGPSPYAATTFRDAHDRPCVMFWLRGIRGDGWTGAHSLPYIITTSDNSLSLSPHPDLDNYHDEATTSGGAADILWPSHAANTLQITESGASRIDIARDGQKLRILIGEHSHSVPWAGDVRVVVDGPILEVSSSAGVFAAPVTPLTEDWELTGPGASMRRLRQHAPALARARQ